MAQMIAWMRRWRWFGGPMLKLKIVLGGEVFEIEGVDATFEQAHSLATDFYTARTAASRAEIAALAGSIDETTNALDAVNTPAP